MKHMFLTLLALLSLTAFAEAQTNGYTQVLYTNHNVAIQGKAFTSSTVDTTQALDISQFITVQIAVQTLDTATCITKYQLSLDGTNWTALAVIDTLSQTADGSVIRSYDCSTIAVGVKFIRWVFSFTAAGVTTPNYTAMSKRIK